MVKVEESGERSHSAVMNHIFKVLVEALGVVMDLFISYFKCDHRKVPKAALLSRVCEIYLLSVQTVVPMKIAILSRMPQM
jgi:hypothetical protein